MDSHPDNKSSEFKISLKDPIDFGEQDWEVALISINYPYSWTNLGPSANTKIKYYLDKDSGVQEINFPDWHCESLEQLVQYIRSKIAVNEGNVPAGGESSRFRVKLDELKRIKIASIEPYFDIGFTDSMLRLLGLESHPSARNMTIKAFDRRQKHRNFLDQVWREDNMLDYTSDALRKIFRETQGFEALVGQVFPYIDQEELKKVAEDMLSRREKAQDITMMTDYLDDIEADPEWQNIQEKVKKLSLGEHVRRDAPEDVEMFETGRFKQSAFEFGLGITLFHLSKILYEKELPKSIKGIIPGNLNPVQRMFIYTDIIQPIDFNETAIQLLRMVNTRGSAFSTTHEEFLQPIYLPLRKGKISMIHVYIADDQQSRVSFQVGTVVLTLHFRRRQLRFGPTRHYYQ
jgi:hypothetical protein